MFTMVTSVSALLLVAAVASAADLRGNAVLYGRYFEPKPPTASSIKEFPGMVSLHNNEGAVCSGSVLDEHHVLTTARCGRLLEEAEATVRSGSSYATSGGKVHKVVSVKVHPSYTPRFDYDVAVLKVDANAPFDKSQFVELVESDSQLETYAPLSLYGWDFYYKDKNFFLEVHPFIGSTECNRILVGSYNPAQIVTDRMICSRVEPRYGKSFNFGSPVLNAQKKQVAISSWNREILSDIVTMHTNLRNKEIQDFIKTALSE